MRYKQLALLVTISSILFLWGCSSVGREDKNNMNVVFTANGEVLLLS